MVALLEGLFLKISALFMSLIISAGTTFGAFVAPTTTEAVNYRDTKIKNVIYLIGDGMGFNHLEKTKSERKIELVMDTVVLTSMKINIRTFKKNHSSQNIYRLIKEKL